MRPASIAVTALLLLSGAPGYGCSSDAGSARTGVSSVELNDDEQALASELIDALNDTFDGSLAKDEARCWISQTVSEIGADRLRSVGLTGAAMQDDDDVAAEAYAELSSSEKAVITNSFSDCVDLEAMLVRTLSDRGEDTPEATECFAEAIDDPAEKAFAQVAIGGDSVAKADPTVQDALSPVMGCMFIGAGESGSGSGS